MRVCDCAHHCRCEWPKQANPRSWRARGGDTVPTYLAYSACKERGTAEEGDGAVVDVDDVDVDDDGGGSCAPRESVW